MPGHEDDRSVLIRSQEPVLLLSFLINHGTGTAPPLPAPLFSNTALAGLGWAGLGWGEKITITAQPSPAQLTCSVVPLIAHSDT